MEKIILEYFAWFCVYLLASIIFFTMLTYLEFKGKATQKFPLSKEVLFWLACAISAFIIIAPSIKFWREISNNLNIILLIFLISICLARYYLMKLFFLLNGGPNHTSMVSLQYAAELIETQIKKQNFAEIEKINEIKKQVNYFFKLHCKSYYKRDFKIVEKYFVHLNNKDKKEYKKSIDCGGTFFQNIQFFNITIVKYCPRKQYAWFYLQSKLDIVNTGVLKQELAYKNDFFNTLWKIGFDQGEIYYLGSQFILRTTSLKKRNSFIQSIEEREV